jgi:hypothetical protein
MEVFAAIGLLLVVSAVWHEVQVWRGRRSGSLRDAGGPADAPPVVSRSGAETAVRRAPETVAGVATSPTPGEA